MFNCEGAGNTACLTTGAQVIESLSFQNHTVAYPVFGQGMLIIGFLLVAFYTLSASQLTFLNLGHVGKKYASLGLGTDLAIAVVMERPPSSSDKDSIPDGDIENDISQKADLAEIDQNSGDQKLQAEAESKSAVEQEEVGLIVVA